MVTVCWPGVSGTIATQLRSPLALTEYGRKITAATRSADANQLKVGGSANRIKNTCGVPTGQKAPRSVERLGGPLDARRNRRTVPCRV